MVTVEELLSPGERLLWSGAPAPGIRFRASDGVILGYASLLIGIRLALSGTRGAGGPGGPIALAIVLSILFVLNLVAFAPWWRARTQYAVTDQRIIIASGVLMRRTESISLRALLDVVLEERMSGIGFIRFVTAGIQTGLPNVRSRFDLLEDPRTVYQIVRAAQAKVTGGESHQGAV